MLSKEICRAKTKTSREGEIVQRAELDSKIGGVAVAQ